MGGKQGPSKESLRAQRPAGASTRPALSRGQLVLLLILPSHLLVLSSLSPLHCLYSRIDGFSPSLAPVPSSSHCTPPLAKSSHPCLTCLPAFSVPVSRLLETVGNMRHPQMGVTVGALGNGSLSLTTCIRMPTGSWSP